MMMMMMSLWFTASPGPVARLHLDTEPYDSPLPSQRSTLRRDSHILAEISELESNFANQEQVNTLASQDSQDSQNLANIMETIETALAEMEDDLDSIQTVAEIPPAVNDTTEIVSVVSDTSETSEPTEREDTGNIELVKLFDDAEQSFNLRLDQPIFGVNCLWSVEEVCPRSMASYVFTVYITYLSVLFSS